MGYNVIMEPRNMAPNNSTTPDLSIYILVEGGCVTDVKVLPPHAGRVSVTVMDVDNDGDEARSEFSKATEGLR